MFRYDLKRETRWCLNESALFLSWKVIREKGAIHLKIAIFFTLTRPGGSRYDLKGSTRVPFDSEHPKDSFGFCPTVLSQLGAKWHGGVATTPPCAF